MKSKKLLSAVLTVSMVFGVSGSLNSVKAETRGDFKDAVEVIEKKEYMKEKFTAKPLVVLMDFPNYKHTELDTKEDWRINKFKGAETTPKFYENLFFGENFYKTSDGKEHITVNKFFKEESGGAYEFKGKVFGWYTADHEAKYYGDNKTGDQTNAAKLVREAIEKVVKNNPNLDLSQFDVEDKWDIDHDKNYNEPDGIIDTVVVVHAGLGEEWGGGFLGEDAIWPFRIGFSWYNNHLDLDKEGEKLKQKNEKGQYPAYNFKDGKGKQWFAEDFTVFEQDLPVDLFDHEYGHVLGLPDLYGNPSSPPVENWSIMGGSYTGDPRGSKPVSYGAYCKQYLQADFEKRNRKANWQNSKVLDLSKIDERGIDVVLDQGSLKGKNNDSIKINLPTKETKIVKMYEGKNAYFSGKGDNMENWMKSKEFLDLTDKKNIKLNFKAWYAIDPKFDFASLMVKEEGTDKWVPVKGNLTTTEVDDWIKENEPKEDWIKRNPGHGITAYSRDVKTADASGWVDAEFDLSEFSGKKIQWGFRFRTDANTKEEGIYIDNINITSEDKKIFEDNAEGDSRFNFEGFSISDGYERSSHYYLLEWRNNENGLVDNGLSTINIGRPGLKYDAGLVMWYINNKYAGAKPDQEVKNHPGELFAGVVDADQEPIVYCYEDGRYGTDRANYQMHDAAFSLKPGSDFKMEANVGKSNHYTVMDKQTYANPCFEDVKNYTATYNKEIGLKLEKYGLKVFVTDESKDRSTVKLHIAKYKDGSQITTQDKSLIKEIKENDGKVYVKTDKIYGDKMYVDYIGKYNKRRQIMLQLKDGVYEGEAKFLEEEKDVDWKIEFLILYDKSGNAKALYNKDVYGIFGVTLGTVNN
ncbi:immune inhibitor A domain-containing protein [Haloimpatiens sp. FM7315]|uniref:immune inhibitor A domain-containing protein n=1 Tax=Haloimpatiens sp. FM7315 TaxID=3298609 RepID=UPI003977D722